MHVFGFDCKMFVGNAGSTPTEQVDSVTTVNLSLSKSQIDKTDRGSGGWKIYAGGLKDVSIEFTYNYDTEDEKFQLFLSSFCDNTPLAVFCADDSGSGIDGDFEVFDFSQPQELDDTVKVSITLKPVKNGKDGRAPAWIVGSKSAE